MGRIISLERHGAVGVLTIHHPDSKANPYDWEFMDDLSAALGEARRDDAVRVVMLTGRGNFFCAGADIAQLAAMDPQTKAMFCLHCQETINQLEQTPKVVIAALNGHTVGGGLEVALACDLRFMAAEDEGFRPRIGTPEVKLGVLPGTGGTQRLPRLIGRQKALRMMLEGQTVRPDEALSLGLVDEVWPRPDFVTRTMAYCDGLAAGATRAQGLIKLAVQQGLELPLYGGLALERELQNRLFVTEDAREGLAAYLDKRQPRFQGR
ncbi:MAG TPA: enoyl-CoA hydratase/isomerase family protein [Candidatus Xenobia bacterium]|jgi:enoyl-CoA hydratase/carnithine racemase